MAICLMFITYALVMSNAHSEDAMVKVVDNLVPEKETSEHALSVVTESEGQEQVQRVEDTPDPPPPQKGNPIKETKKTEETKKFMPKSVLSDPISLEEDDGFSIKETVKKDTPAEPNKVSESGAAGEVMTLPCGWIQLHPEYNRPPDSADIAGVRILRGANSEYHNGLSVSGVVTVAPCLISSGPTEGYQITMEVKNKGDDFTFDAVQANINDGWRDY